MAGRDYGPSKDLISHQDADRITSENACQKSAGNGRRLKKCHKGKSWEACLLDCDRSCSSRRTLWTL